MIKITTYPKSHLLAGKPHVRGYFRESDRKRAIAQLRRFGWTHFATFMDVQAPFAVMCAWRFPPSDPRPG
jgi:hypothetical protein